MSFPYYECMKLHLMGDTTMIQLKNSGISFFRVFFPLFCQNCHNSLPFSLQKNRSLEVHKPTHVKQRRCLTKTPAQIPTNTGAVLND